MSRNYPSVPNSTVSPLKDTVALNKCLKEIHRSTKNFPL